MECKQSDMCHDKPWLFHCVKQQNMLLLPEILPPYTYTRVYYTFVYPSVYNLLYTYYIQRRAGTRSKEGCSLRALCASCIAPRVKPLNSQYLRRLQSSRHSSFSLEHEKADKQQTHHSCFKIYLD